MCKDKEKQGICSQSICNGIWVDGSKCDNVSHIHLRGFESLCSFKGFYSFTPLRPQRECLFVSSQCLLIWWRPTTRRTWAWSHAYSSLFKKRRNRRKNQVRHLLLQNRMEPVLRGLAMMHSCIILVRQTECQLNNHSKTMP